MVPQYVIFLKVINSKYIKNIHLKIIKKGPKENVGLTEVKDIQPNAEIKKLNNKNN